MIRHTEIGIKEIIELELPESEKEQFRNSADVIKSYINKI